MHGFTCKTWGNVYCTSNKGDKWQHQNGPGSELFPHPNLPLQFFSNKFQVGIGIHFILPALVQLNHYEIEPIVPSH